MRVGTARSGTPAAGGTRKLSVLHLVAGVSDVRLTLGNGRGFVVSWDELGKDNWARGWCVLLALA